MSLIHDPWLITHKREDGTMETFVCREPDDKRTYQQYALVIADAVRHVANAFNVDEADVFAWVQKEMDDPTTDIMRTGPN